MLHGQGAVLESGVSVRKGGVAGVSSVGEEAQIAQTHSFDKGLFPGERRTGRLHGPVSVGRQDQCRKYAERRDKKINLGFPSRHQARLLIRAGLTASYVTIARPW
jgi:hypothetical protein